MHFDLLKAMAEMKENFGNTGEILVTQSAVGLHIQLRTTEFGQVYSYRYTISKRDLPSYDTRVAKLFFRRAIAKLKDGAHGTMIGAGSGD